MTVAALALIIVAAALRTRLARLWLALLLLRTGSALRDAGVRVLARVKREMGQ